MTDPEPEHLVMPAAEFAGARFWAAAGRLAARLGHGGHDRYLAGETERTDRYTLECVSCQRAIAVFTMQREAPTGHAEGSVRGGVAGMT